MRPGILTLALLAIAASPAIADDSLRCGSKIIRVGMSMSEVREHCGSPTSSSIEEQDVRSGNRVVGKTQMHVWMYDRGATQRNAILEFDQEQLVSLRYVGE